MTQNFNYDWALVLRDYALDRHLDGEKNYNACQDIIQEAGDGFFRITGNATCRYSRNMAILQMKELPWEYLFQCMKISDKDFLIKLPTHLHDNKFRANSDGEVYVYAWYDPELNAIQVFNNTGNIREEEDTSPGHDGYGRFDRDYERVRGVIDAKCQWKKKPYLSWGSLYSL